MNVSTFEKEEIECEYINECRDVNEVKCNECMNNKEYSESKRQEVIDNNKESYFTQFSRPELPKAPQPIKAHYGNYEGKLSTWLDKIKQKLMK